MFGWIAFLAVLLLFACLAIWRWPKVGTVTAFAALYAFYQVSSLYFLVPLELYKDGGNGTFADWPVWAVWSSLCVGALWLAIHGLKRFLVAR